MRGECEITFQRDVALNWNHIAGDWKQWKRKVRAMWGRITDEDLEEIQGRYEVLVGKIQQRYGAAREEADRQVREWVDSLSPTRWVLQSD